MNYDIIEAFGQIAAEKNLAIDYVLETVEAALVSAVKKKYPEVEENVRVNINRSEGEIQVFLTKKVVETIENKGTEMTIEEASEYYEDVEVGQELDVPLPFEEFGRNAITTAKQILIQKVREAEREKFRQGDRIRAVIIDVQNSNRGPQIFMSRSSDDFLKKLFELEVPEISEKIIEIKAIARESGERSKVAVYSNDDRIDAVGACVGVKGVRVQNIVRELNNERIDIVPWSSEPMIFVTKALAPAKIVNVDVFMKEMKMLVAVADDKLSLAIGKAGQNARLAAKLTGWKINIMSETEYDALKKSEEAERVDIEAVDAIGAKNIQRLIQAGFETARDIVESEIENLVAIDGIGEKTAEKIILACKEAIDKAAEELAQAFEESAEESAGELEFSPEDKAAPGYEDY